MADGFVTHFDSVSPGGGDKRGDGRGRKGKRSLDENEGGGDGGNGKRKKAWGRRSEVHLQKLAQEKTEECITLKRVSGDWY